MYLNLRPGLVDFLEEVSEYFEIILFNNDSQVFTNAVVSKIEERIRDKAKCYFSYALSAD